MSLLFKKITHKSLDIVQYTCYNGYATLMVNFSKNLVATIHDVAGTLPDNPNDEIITQKEFEKFYNKGIEDFKSKYQSFIGICNR